MTEEIDELGPPCPLVYLMMTKEEREKDMERALRNIERSYRKVIDGECQGDSAPLQ